MESGGEPRLLQTLRAHRGEVSCADACGARLATGAGDRSLRLWRWAAGAGWVEHARAAAAHRYGVTAARWAASGALLASGGVDGTARVWCGRTLSARRTLAAPGAPAVRALCWAGRRLLVGHDDGALCVWLVARGVQEARLLAHEGALHAVAAPARATLLLTACTHGVLKVFDLAEVCRSGSGSMAPAPLTWVDGAHDLGALCADAAEHGRVAATGGHDARVCVWRAEGGTLAAAGVLEGHAAAVTALRWAPGGALLASASLDRTARLWAPDNGSCLHVLHAHARYLTCIALAQDMRYMITGSNDKSVRMWSLGALALDDELEPACSVLVHFALGDLEGIGPVEGDDLQDDMLAEETGGREDEGEGEVDGVAGGARRVWLQRAHAGAINCVAASGDLLATASSDGLVKVFRWVAEETALTPAHALQAHQYPAMAVDFGASGALLLSAGLDGRATLWDVQTGVQLRTLCVPSGGDGGGGGGGEAGGGGVRDARVSTHRPPLLLLATDDGLAPLWSLAAAEPTPLHVFGGHVEAATCCAWSRDGRLAATGAASGELRVHAPRPAPHTLFCEPHAHDLGVQSCDFAPARSALELDDASHLLATGGCDSYIKLWLVDCAEDDDGVLSGSARLLQQLEAHGGGVTSVRWGEGAGGALLASAGADGWARVWRVAGTGAGSQLCPLAGVPASGAGGALAAALLQAATPLLAVGTMAGELALWQLPAASAAHDEPEDVPDDDEGDEPWLWAEPGVARWLREYVTRAPGSEMSRDQEAALLARARAAALTGARLLRDPLDELLQLLGYGEVEDQSEELAEWAGADACTRARLRDELRWLRRASPPRAVEESAPHALLCPLTHRLLREPARAADGFSYERANILDWFVAAGAEPVSPLSGRRLRSARAAPNYALRERLRAYLAHHAA